MSKELAVPSLLLVLWSLSVRLPVSRTFASSDNLPAGAYDMMDPGMNYAPGVWGTQDRTYTVPGPRPWSELDLSRLLFALLMCSIDGEGSGSSGNSTVPAAPAQDAPVKPVTTSRMVTSTKAATPVATKPAAAPVAGIAAVCHSFNVGDLL